MGGGDSQRQGAPSNCQRPTAHSLIRFQWQAGAGPLAAAQGAQQGPSRLGLPPRGAAVLEGELPSSSSLPQHLHKVSRQHLPCAPAPGIPAAQQEAA